MKRSTTNNLAPDPVEPVIQIKTPWWYVTGSLMFLTKIVFGWAEIKISGYSEDEKRLWLHCIKHFCISCLSCSGCPGFGFTLNFIRRLFNNLMGIPLKEVAQVLGYAAPVHFLRSDLKDKIFNFKVNCVGNPESLFNVVLSQPHVHCTWLNETNCKNAQQGLKSLLVDRVECTLESLSTHFGNYVTHIQEFELVADFAVWWCDLKQKRLRLKQYSFVLDQLFLLESKIQFCLPLEQQQI